MSESSIIRPRGSIGGSSLLASLTPARGAGYAGQALSFAPAIAAGLQPGFTLFNPSSALDAYVLEVFASILVTTAGTAGRTSLQLQMLTADGTVGTTGQTPLDNALPASACTYRANPATNGTTTRGGFCRQLVLGPTAAVTTGPPLLVPIFSATTLSDAIVLRAGANSGLQGNENQEVAGVAIAYEVSWHVRWIEL